MPLVGFLPATDARMRATIDVIARELTGDRLVLRYRNQAGLNPDGLTGKEGTFVICSFWLAPCLAQAGAIDRAVRRSSSALPVSPTTSGSSPRRSTLEQASCSATSLKRSATSG
jgi:GH15 family glucan-1,4-alpha-glucosidase